MEGSLPTTVPEVLRSAASIIETRGWCTGMLYSEPDPSTAPCCARGAIFAALDPAGRASLPDRAKTNPATDRLSEATQRALGAWLSESGLGANIHSWNDSQATDLNMRRDWSYVPRVLRRAAEALEVKS